MSYDIKIGVKVEGLGAFAPIATPDHDSPTYNLREMFVACMDWDYEQGKYYPCTEVLSKVEKGIRELTTKPKIYDKYNPPNGWGSRTGAIETLESLRRCILENAEEVPIEYLWMCW